MTRRKTTRAIRAVISIGFLILPLVVASSGVEAASLMAIDTICTPTVEVMPLGDSITKGSSSGVDEDNKKISYRKDLWDDLTAAGYSVDFVGSLTHGDFYAGFDPHHEGHAGWNDDQIAEYVYNNNAEPGANWLSQNPPDVILLHIGTNAFDTNPSDVEDILDEINEYEIDTGRSVIVIVARIIDWVPNNGDVTTFNDNVAAMVAARPDYGSELFMVDMEDGAGIIYSLQPAGDMWDKLHPFATGYTKMADVWKAKYDEIYASYGANCPPDVTPVSDQSDDEGDTISLQIVAPDPDGDPITYAAVNLPDGLSINHTTGWISGTIGGGASNGSPYHVQVTAGDGKPFGSTTIGFDWTISNPPPEITQPADQLNIEGDTVSLQIEATDPDEDSLVYSAPGLPTGLSIHASTGEISGTILSGASTFSPYTITAAVDDGEADPVEATFIWTVDSPPPPNAPPEIVQPANQLNKEGDPVSLQIEATDPDEDSLEFSAPGLPTGLSIHASTGLISGTILSGASTFSPYTVTVTVNDGIADPVPATFTWLIIPNTPPEITQPDDQVHEEGDPVSLQIEATDPDKDLLSYSAPGLPTGLSIHPSTGLISGAIQSGSSTFSPYTVTVTADDGIADPVPATFTWTVKNPLYFIYLPLVTE